MPTFDKLVSKFLSENSFSLDPSDISEIVTDASNGKLSPEEMDSLEDDLNNLMDKIYKKYKGSLDGVELFWKEAEKIGKAYRVKIKQ